MSVKKKVYQFNDKGVLIDEFDSIESAAKELNLLREGIVGCLKGSRQSCGGFIFSEKEELDIGIGDIICKVCNFNFNNTRSLASHLQHTHKLKTEEYTIKYIHNGIKPMCYECGKETRYVSFSFKKYCKEHSYIAESEAGKVGGKEKSTWNKGLTKDTDKRINQQAESMKGENNHFFGKRHTEEIIQLFKEVKQLTKEQYEERINSRKELKVLTEYADYYSRQNQDLDVICLTCGGTLKMNLENIERKMKCRFCFPSSVSKAELELLDFLRPYNLNIIHQDRELIGPKELDIYIPEKKFAIEYNGLYWHRLCEENTTITKNTHRDKTRMCKEKDVQLFHIFSDEWNDNKELLKSMILNRIGLIPNKIFARNCIVKEVSKQEENLFFNASHISKYTKSEKCFGLYVKGTDKLVASLSLRRPFHKGKYDGKIEIARFASNPFTVVVGAFSKLLVPTEKYCKEMNYHTIISYADLRFGEGKAYLNNGFTFIEELKSIPYWYTDCKIRYNRFKFRAQLGKTEAQVAEENKVWKVYGVGNYLYEKKL